MSWHLDLYLNQVEELMTVNLNDFRVYGQLERENQEMIKVHNASVKDDVGVVTLSSGGVINRPSKKLSPMLGQWVRKVTPEVVELFGVVIPDNTGLLWSHAFPGVQSYNIKEKTLNVAVTKREFLRCKPQQMKIGKYLRRLNRYTDQEVNDYANACKSALARIEKAELELAHGSEAIMDVYKRGPNSCMSGDQWRQDINPIAVYGTPDIACAFVEIDGKIKARTMINLIENTYSVIYGNETLIEPLLEEAGYDSGCLDGCRIKRIEFSFDVFLMPYIDDVDGVSYHDDDYFVVGGYDYRCDETNGLTSSGTCCPHCEEHFDPDYDGIWVEPAETSYCSGECAEADGYIEAVSNSRYDCYEWVSDDDAYLCETDGRYYTSTDSLILVDDLWYDEEDEDIVYSEDQNEYIFSCDAVWIEDIDSWVDSHREYEFEEDDEEDDEYDYAANLALSA